MADRKKDHIDLALQSQTSRDILDRRFTYEPMLASHPSEGLSPFTFLGKTFRAPMWVSSMTGGTAMASKINRNLAMVCNEFGFGMGLGSCRSLLDNTDHLRDFDVRNLIGEDLPLFANLGICQVEQLVEMNQVKKIETICDRLRTDGLIVHVNPMQEWFQREGDLIKHPPIETISRLIDQFNLPVIVKEVGQGMGPASLLSLLKLPLAAIEFAAFGGTNFAKTELLRDPASPKELFEPLTHIGMDACEMMEMVNGFVRSEKNLECKQIIVSGGIKSFLDGYYLVKKSLLPAIFGQAISMLQFAKEDYAQLQSFVSRQIRGLELASAYLRIRQ